MRSGQWKMCASCKYWTREESIQWYLLDIDIRVLKNGFLLWWDSMFDMYAAIGTWNICFEDMKFEIEKMFVWLDVMGLSTFMLFHVLPSASLVQNRRGYLRNVYVRICIRLCDRARNFQSIDSVASTYMCACAVLDCVEFWCTPRKSWICCYFQV